MREALLDNKSLLLKIEQIEKKLLKQDITQQKQEDDIQYIFEALKQLLTPPVEQRKRIGFKNDE